MSGVPIRARKASEPVKREEGGVKLQQDGGTDGAHYFSSSWQSSPSFHWSLSSVTGLTSTQDNGNLLPSSHPRPPPVLSRTSPVVELLGLLPSNEHFSSLHHLSICCL